MEAVDLGFTRGRRSVSGSLKAAGNYIWRSNGAEAFSRSSSSREEDDEEALRWAALEKLPTFNRLRKGLMLGPEGAATEVDIDSLGFAERKALLERLVNVADEDNEKFLMKLRDRVDRVGIELPSIEVRYESLNVEAVAYEGSRALPSFINFITNFIEDLLDGLHVTKSKKRKITILNDVSGIIKPCRMTLLLGPPASGKTTLLLALAGKLPKDLKVGGRVTYNGHEMNEFVPQRTAAYISQHDLHIGEMTVRETLEFSARCQGVGYRYEMLAELSRREKAANIKPDPDIDVYMKYRKNGNLPPGPWRLPLIGSMHHLLGAYPLRRLGELAKIYGPLMHVQLGEVTAIIASSPDMAKAVFKTHDLAFASRPKLLHLDILFYNRSDIIFAPYGDYWRQMRKIVVLELLTNKNVQRFGSIRRDQLSRLLELVRSHEGRPVNMTEMIFRSTSGMLCRSAFGSVFEQRDEFITLIREVMDLLGGWFDVADIFPSLRLLHGLSPMRRRIMRIHKKVDAILDNVIDGHKKSLAAGSTGNGEMGGEDVIDVLLGLKRTGGLQFPITDDNIKAVVFDLFTAGTETSSTAVIWAMVEMLRSPRVLAKAQDEVRGAGAEFDVEQLKYMKMVVKETLRLHPPSPVSFPRECMEETEIDGYRIPAKTWITVNIQSISRDPEYWENAESFEPERFENSGVDFLGNNYQFLPFGGGRRICPGLSFGLANVHLPLANLLYHFDWKLPRGIEHARSLDLRESPGLTAWKKDDLYLVATPYTP